MNKTKQCGTCKETKATSEFNKNNSKKDGLAFQCRSCQSAYQRARAKTLVPQTPDTKQCNTCKEIKAASEFPKDNSNKDGLRGQCKACNAGRNRKHYEGNRERILETSRKYQEANPDKRKAYGQRRRARKQNAPGNATAEDIKARFEYYGNKCLYCRTEENLHIEHRIPLARGGSNHPANLAPACQPCNCSKGTKTETEFKVFLLTRNREIEKNG